METVAEKLSGLKIGVVRFNFPYIDAGRKAPGSPRQAIDAIVKVYNSISADYNQPLFVGGKSYGGRMASAAVAEGLLPEVRGLVYFGFPLHAPGKPSVKRAEHLDSTELPMLFLQGKKDKLAEIPLIREVTEKIPNATLIEFEDADHSFKVPKKADLTQEEVFDTLTKEAASWMKEN